MTNISDKTQEGVRIAKYIADCGYCSRRDAEKLILEGLVKVNGKVISSPTVKITDHSVKINNKLINNQQRTRLFIINKPKSCLTSHKDPQDRPLVFDLVPKELPRLVSVGRLDFNTEGLLLLTNNGQLSKYISDPKTGWIRKYRARVYGKVDLDRLKRLEGGVKIDGIFYKSIKAEVESQSGSNSWLKISITEGKNREIRKVMEYIDLKVNRLIRTSFGPFNLGNLPNGNIKEVKKSVIKSFLPHLDLK